MESRRLYTIDISNQRSIFWMRRRRKAEEEATMFS